LAVISNNLKKSTGPGCALIIHDKVGNVACFVYPDHLAVLTAAIDNGSDIRHEEMGPFGMADNLRNGPICKRIAFGA
jgi:hypothetical protein